MIIKFKLTVTVFMRIEKSLANSLTRIAECLDPWLNQKNLGNGWRQITHRYITHKRSYFTVQQSFEIHKNFAITPAGRMHADR